MNSTMACGHPRFALKPARTEHSTIYCRFCAYEAEIERLRNACITADYNVRETLAPALGFHEVDGLPTYGDMLGEDLAELAVKKIADLRRIIDMQNAALERLQETP